MWFLAFGLVLLALWGLDVSPFAALHWGWIVAPFAAAAAWWGIADATGLTRQRAMRRMEERKQARRERDMAALGLNVQRDKRVRILRDPGKRGSPPAPPRDRP